MQYIYAWKTDKTWAGKCSSLVVGWCEEGHRYPPEVRSQEEIERLLDACGRSFTERRIRTLLVLLSRCGLRLSKTLALEP